MRIPRLFMKIYLCFLGVFIVFFLLILVLIYYQFEKPLIDLQKRHTEYNDFLSKTSLIDPGLKNDLKSILELKRNDLAFYDKNGRVMTKFGEEGRMLSPEVMRKALSDGYYFEVSENKDSIFFLSPFNAFKSQIGFLAFTFHLIYTKEKARDFLILMFLAIITLSIVVYILSRNLSDPLEKLTKKAIMISHGDFSSLESEKKNPDSNDEINTLGIAFDYMTKEISSLNEIKKELFSHISHELGSPISRMTVAVEILENKTREGKLPSEKLIKNMAESINDMTNLLEELRELSTIDVKGYRIRAELHDPFSIAETTIENFRNLAEKNSLMIKIDRYGNSHLILMDQEKITRVIKNLLQNAIKYSPQRSTINIQLKMEKEHFSFTIKDEGGGVKKENAEKIFEPFFREDTSRTRETGGTGLGLAIARKILKLHGGNIWLENPGENGAQITFTI